MHFVCVVTGMYISTIMVMNKDECNDKEDLDILGEMKSSLPEQIYLLCSVVMKIKLLTTFYLAPVWMRRTAMSAFTLYVCLLA